MNVPHVIFLAAIRGGALLLLIAAGEALIELAGFLGEYL